MAHSSFVVIFLLSMAFLVVCAIGQSPTSSPTLSPTKSSPPSAATTPTATTPVSSPAVTVNTPPFYVPGPVVAPSYISASPSEAPAPSPLENAAVSNTVQAAAGSLALWLFAACFV